MNTKTIIGMIILIVLVSACAQQPQVEGESENTNKGVSAGGDTAYVRIKDYKFVPRELHIKEGTTVLWKNDDPAPHKIMTSDGNIESNLLEKGDTKQFTFTDKGTYNYICPIHPSMQGSITVN